MGKRQIRRQKTKIKSRGWRHMILASFAMLFSVYLIACTMPEEGKIINNTYVNHVEVSGLGQEEAAIKIQKDFEKSYAHQALTVDVLGEKYSVMINDSLRIDAGAAAERAYRFAHGSFLTRGYGVLKASLFGQRFSWNAHIYDEAALINAVKASGLADINTTTQTTYEVQGDELIFQKGSTGVSVDQPALIDKLKKAVQSDDYVSVIDSPLVTGTVEETDMDQVYKDLHAQKRNATLDPEHKYRIVSSVDGIDFDVKSARSAFDSAENGSRVVVPLVIERPEVTTEDLKKYLFRDVLGSCTLDMEGSDDRIHNIELTAKKLNGEIVLAGKTFSFNKAVGERTEDRGFLWASAYSDGQTDGETGGGVSQVSSALYKAAMLSNLKIKKRHSSTYISNYIDMGMEAVVSGKEKDFSFKNNTKYPVKILADCKDGRLSVKLMGAKLDKTRVEITSEVIKMTERGIEYRDDPNMLKGESAVISDGGDGYEIQTWRKIYDESNKLQSSKKEAHSEYQARNKVVAVGSFVPEPVQETPEQTGESGQEDDASKVTDSSNTAEQSP